MHFFNKTTNLSVLVTCFGFFFLDTITKVHYDTKVHKKRYYEMLQLMKSLTNFAKLLLSLKQCIKETHKTTNKSCRQRKIKKNQSKYLKALVIYKRRSEKERE